MTVVCAQCRGAGWIGEGDDPERCTTCEGYGYTPRPTCASCACWRNAETDLFGTFGECWSMDGLDEPLDKPLRYPPPSGFCEAFILKGDDSHIRKRL